MSRAPIVVLHPDLNARATWAQQLIDEGDVRGHLLHHSIRRHEADWHALLRVFESDSLTEDQRDALIAWLEPFLSHWPPSLRTVPDTWRDTLLIEGNCNDAIDLCRALDLSETALYDLEPIAFLSQLTDLSLTGTDILDLAPISEFFDLQVLDLSQTPIDDLGPITELAALRYLDLSDTEVTDITPLANLQHLRYLDLSDTAVRDVSPLAGLRELQQLYISDSAIEDLSPIQVLLDRGLMLVS